MRYNKGDIELETIGQIGNPQSSDFINSLRTINDEEGSIPIIQGMTTIGQSVTLRGCYRVGIKPTLGGLTTYRYRTDSMFVGHLFENSDEIKFNELHATYSNFKKWHLQSGISFDLSQMQEQNIGIKYSAVEKTSINISENLKLEINVAPTIHKDNFEFMASIEETPHVIIKANELTSLKKLFEAQQCFRHFLMLAMMDSSHPYWYVGYIGDKKVEVYPNLRLYDEIPEIKSPDRMLFTYPKVLANFPQLIESWWSVFEQYKDELITYFSAILNKTLTTIELQFQIIILALESYHRKKFPESDQTSEEYEKMISNMIEKLQKNDEQIKFVKKFKKMGNSPNLKQRLLKLVEISPQTFDNTEEEKSKFCEDVMNTRNYFSHGTEELKEKALTSSKLFFIVQQMKILMDGLLLHELPLEENVIDEIMVGNRKARNYAKEHPIN